MAAALFPLFEITGFHWAAWVCEGSGCFSKIMARKLKEAQ